MKAVLLTSLRGNPIVYQGEELGLTQVDIPFERLQDPEAIANWPLTLSRDGARTPLPWVAQDEHGGFSVGAPWLPLGEDNLARAVDRQEQDPSALLHLTRQLLGLRRENPALRWGGYAVLHADECSLAARRSDGKQSIACVFNFTSQAVPWPDGVGTTGKILASVNGADLGTLPPFGALLIEEQA